MLCDCPSRYKCLGGAKCVPDRFGQYKDLATCIVKCPAPQAPPSACDGGEDSSPPPDNGNDTEKPRPHPAPPPPHHPAQPHQPPPPPQERYACDWATGKCVVSDAGPFPSAAACMQVCLPPPPRKNHGEKRPIPEPPHPLPGGATPTKAKPVMTIHPERVPPMKPDVVVGSWPWQTVPVSFDCCGGRCRRRFDSCGMYPTPAACADACKSKAGNTTWFWTHDPNLVSVGFA
jgi:hypothetical protein